MCVRKKENVYVRERECERERETKKPSTIPCAFIPREGAGGGEPGMVISPFPWCTLPKNPKWLTKKILGFHLYLRQEINF